MPLTKEERKAYDRQRYLNNRPPLKATEEKLTNKVNRPHYYNKNKIVYIENKDGITIPNYQLERIKTEMADKYGRENFLALVGALCNNQGYVNNLAKKEKIKIKVKQEKIQPIKEPKKSSKSKKPTTTNNSRDKKKNTTTQKIIIKNEI